MALVRVPWFDRIGFEKHETASFGATQSFTNDVNLIVIRP